MSDRTIDRDIFEIGYEKNFHKKKELIKKNENKLVENINDHCLHSFSGDITINDSKEFNKKKSDIEQEISKRELFDLILNNDSNSNKFKISIKTFTTCLIRDRTLLCKIKKSHVKMKYGKKTTIYHLYTDYTNKFLLSCKKVSNLMNTEYIFSMSDNPINCPNESIIGKVVSKFFGNEYNIYDVSQDNENNRFIGTVDYVI